MDDLSDSKVYLYNINISLLPPSPPRTEETSTKEEMDRLKGPIMSKTIATLAEKLKHMALNVPLQFSIQTLRPQSENTARFGSLSYHSFFSQHNPHPHKVTHIQGKHLGLRKTIKYFFLCSKGEEPSSGMKSQNWISITLLYNYRIWSRAYKSFWF